jgi:hypothetical protein
MFHLLRIIALVVLPVLCRAQDSASICKDCTDEQPGVLRYFLLAVIAVGVVVMIYEKKQRDKHNQS